MANNEPFPSDENGDVLRRMAADGVDLSSPRVVDFEHCFPNEASARRFREAARAYVSSAELIPPNGDRGWEVQCRQRMIPTHAAISGTEARLAALAEQVGGHADGLGLSGGVKVTTCFA